MLMRITSNRANIRQGGYNVDSVQAYYRFPSQQHLIEMTKIKTRTSKIHQKQTFATLSCHEHQQEYYYQASIIAAVGEGPLVGSITCLSNDWHRRHQQLGSDGWFRVRPVTERGAGAAARTNMSTLAWVDGGHAPGCHHHHHEVVSSASRNSNAVQRTIQGRQAKLLLMMARRWLTASKRRHSSDDDDSSDDDGDASDDGSDDDDKDDSDDNDSDDTAKRHKKKKKNKKDEPHVEETEDVEIDEEENVEVVDELKEEELDGEQCSKKRTTTTKTTRTKTQKTKQTTRRTSGTTASPQILALAQSS